MTLTVERLKELLSYDPQTGVFYWRVAACPRIGSGCVAGSQNGDGYLRIMIGGKKYRAHRLAWLYAYGEWPTNQIDHIDGDKANNRISNLRQATQSQNLYNRGAYSTNKSGFKGVAFGKLQKRWRAQIVVSKKRVHLGYFNTPKEAYAAYCAAAAKIHGEFARTA